MSPKHFNYECASHQQGHLHPGCGKVSGFSTLVATGHSRPCPGPVGWVLCLGKPQLHVPGPDPCLLICWCFVTSNFLTNSPLTVVSPPRAPVLRVSNRSPSCDWLLSGRSQLKSLNRICIGSSPSLCLAFPPGHGFLATHSVRQDNGESRGMTGLMPPCLIALSFSFLGLCDSQHLEDTESWRAPKPSALTAPTVPCGMWFLMWEAVYWGIIMLFARH